MAKFQSLESTMPTFFNAKFCQIFLILFIIFTVFTGRAFADTQPPSVKVNMRNHGYTMGDEIHQKIQINLPANESIDLQSLPLAGYINPWLDLKSVSFKQEGQTATLQLVWQIFATVEFTQVLKTPEMGLKTTANKSPKIIVPPQPFYYSAVLPQSVVDIQRRQNLYHLVIDTFSPILVASIFATLALIGFAVWWWLQDRFSWLPYSAGPMTKLARKLKGQLVISLHHAELVYETLNQCAGKNIYLNNQAAFFEHATYLKPYDTEIMDFLYKANQVIYNHDALGHGQSQPPQNLGASAWVQEAAMAERLFRRQKRQQKHA